MITKYQSVEEIAASESFQDYCLRRTQVSKRKWDSYIASNPEQMDMIEEAKFLVMMFGTDNALHGNTPTEEPRIQSKQIPRKKMSVMKFALPIIAVIILIILVLPTSFTSLAPTITKNAEGQNLSLMLSDLSNINLRDGSSIRFAESWERADSRDVWLDGEAFFDVKSMKKENKPFTVNLSKGIIHVLGTKFLVKSDTTSTFIALEEGLVNFEIDGTSYELQAGDVIKYDDQNINIQRSKNTRLYDSWRNAQMSFKNASLQSIINTINNSYELEVVLENTKLKERKITATVKQNDPRLLLKAISTIYDIQITEKDNKIILK